MGLLSGLLVNGIRNTGSTALSRAIGSAVGSGEGRESIPPVANTTAPACRNAAHDRGS